MKLNVKKGRTSLIVNIFIQDSASTVGAGKTGILYNASGLVAYYARSDQGNAGGTAITLATATRGTWATGGFIEKDSTNMPGVYELHLPNAVLATGADSVVVMLKGATGMAPCVLEVALVDYDPQDSVRLGVTALPNAAAEAAGGLYTRGSGAGQINQNANGQVDTRWVGGNVTVATNNDKTGYSLTQTFPTNFSSMSIDASGRVDVIKINGTSQTARDIGASVLLSAGTGTGQLDFTSGVVKSNNVQILGTTLTETVGGYLAAAFKKLFDVAVPVLTSASVNQTGDSYARLGAPAGASVSADVAAVKSDTGGIKAKTDSLTFTVAGKLDANVYTWNGTAVATPDTAGYPKVTIKYGTGTGELSATAGVPDTNVTTIQGTTATTQIQTAVFTYVVENSLTFVQQIRGMFAALTGKASGLSGTTATYRDNADTKNRISATVDTDGNRSAVTLDLT